MNRRGVYCRLLIHSPDDNELFKECPLIEVSKWVKYQKKNKPFVKVHQFYSGEVQELYSCWFYVWDQVSLVFHLTKH